MGEASLYEFVSGLSKTSQCNIRSGEEILELMIATSQAAKRNIGVGGTPSMVALYKSRLYQPDEDTMKLSTEIAQGVNAGLLRHEWVFEEIKGLVFEGKPFDNAEHAMWAEARRTSSERGLNLLFRGYKN